MLSPMMTVLVLAVLWAIVVVPMLVKFWTERAGQRSVDRFGVAMQALSTRRSLGALARPAPTGDLHARAMTAQPRSSRSQTFVPGGATRTTPAARRPVPAAMEAVMYSDRIARVDMSDARRQMMARRRRSLCLLVLGTVTGMVWGIAAGGISAWATGSVCTVGLLGYLYSLRSRALRDRDRRESRLNRSGLNYSRGYDATEELMQYPDVETVVRIDDDDVALHGIADTVDLTGLYQDEQFDDGAMRRAV